MKRLTALAVAVLVSLSLYSQEVTTYEKAARDTTLSDLLEIASEMADIVIDTPVPEPVVEKPRYWDNGITTQLGFSQIGLTQWADGSNQSLSLNTFVDAYANYKKDLLFWENRLQMGYGFQSDIDNKFTKKTDDRFQFDSKFGYNIFETVYLSAQYSFKTQFSNGFKYEGITIVDKESGLFAPAYTNLAIGLDYKPTKWLSVNFAPLTGGVVIVADTSLCVKYGNYKVQADGTNLLMPVRFELGAQLKADIQLKIGSSVDFASYLTLFSNYLDKPQNIRVTWDTVTDYKLNKFFSINFRTYLLYDDKVMIQDSKNPDAPARQRVQFKEIFTLGFTYSFGI